MDNHRRGVLFSAGLPVAAALLILWGIFSLLPAPDAQARLQVAAPTVNPLRISQVYGGGGNSGAQYKNDFIELLNAGSVPVNLNGWSVQYASAAGTAWQVTSLGNLTLQPGMYLLVKEAQGVGGTVSLPPADVTGTIPMSSQTGKVALVSTTTLLVGSCPAGTSVIDFVGYGSTANCSEGSPVATLSNPTSAVRNGEGCLDTDNNANDFSLVTPPTPRNRASPVHLCAAASSPTITKLAPMFALLGSAYTYSITVRNDMAIDLVGVMVSDTLPAGTTFASASVGGTFDGHAVHWTAGYLPTSTSFEASFVVTATLTPTVVVNAAYSMTASNFVTPTFGAAASTIVDDRLHIHSLQGPGAASPFDGRYVQGIVGIVTSLQPDGFFMQDPQPDADPATSEGIFVSTGGAPGVQLGQAATVFGPVIEQNSFTELVRTALAPSPTTTVIAPTSVDLPVPSDLEPYEGMLVTFPEMLTASQNYFQGRYGQVTLSAEGRMFQPGDGNGLGDTPPYNLRRMIVLDDNSNAQDPNPIPYIGLENTLRAGDIISGLTGVVDYGLISSDGVTRFYRLQPTINPIFTRLNPRTPASPAFEGNLKVAGFNVYNYFNGDGLGGGFPTARGATTLAEFNRQRDKIISALAAFDADVVGLMEIERDGDGATSAIQDLVSGLNAVAGSGTYAFIPDPADTGSDQIKVALIYKPARVTPLGSPLSSSDAVFSRPPLAQTFRLNANGQELTVVVNHFKSKSCDSATGLELDYGQGCYNNRRVLQAQALLAFIEALKTSSGDPDVLAIGDYNAYGEEDPILALTNGGLTNLALMKVPAIERYSYIFDGQSGYLDHALATPSMAAQVSGMTFWHINSDEPSVIDYNLEFKSQDLYSPTPFRSSDHDPAVVGITLRAPFRLNLPLMLR